MDLRDFYTAWCWLCNHPAFDDPRWPNTGGFTLCLEIEVAKVDSLTNEINTEQPARNTKTAVWLECGPMILPTAEQERYGATGVIHTHDSDLDCGGDTFEEAIVEMAALVLAKYGNYEPREEG